MPALVAGIHAFLVAKTWMAGTSPAMTEEIGIKSGAGLFVIFRERSLGIDRTLEREAETPPAGPAV